MKALDEYFLMVVFMLLLNGVHVFEIFCLIWTDMAVKGKLRITADVVSIALHQSKMLFLEDGFMRPL